MEPDVGQWRPIPGETPIDPSGLRDRSITTRGELNRAEALNIRKAFLKYLAATPTKRVAPFDYAGSFAYTRRCIATCGNGQASYGSAT